MFFRRRTYLIWIALTILLPAYLSAPLLAYTIPTNGFPKIEVNGSNTLSLNLNSVEGSQSYYNDDNYDRNKTLTNSTNLYLHGELYKDLFLDASLMMDQYSPSNTRWTLQYRGSDAKVTLGEFTANLGDNEFVLLNRFLRGVQVDAVLPKGSLTAITSQLKSPVRTDTFYGRNVSGPYYLSATPVIDASEVVMINNARKERGADYTLDYTNGILYFSPGIIVGPADQVTVSYEVGGSGLGGGTLVAVRGSYPVNDKVNVGVSHLRLNGRNSGGSELSKQDQFIGNNGPGPFYLTYGPIVEGSDIVTINGFPQQRGIAYTINYATRSILFTGGFEPPYQSTVTVRYRVTAAENSGGDRAVTGMDVNWKVADGLNVNVQAAKSEGGDTKVIPSERVDRLELVVSQPGEVFILPKAPIQEGTLVVRVPTRIEPLVMGTDYMVEYGTGRLQVKSTVPSGTLLSISYTTAGQTVQLKGNSAMSVAADYNKDKVTARVRYRQVEEGFAPLEMVGFRRADSALDWSGSYAITDALNFTMTGDNTRQPYNPFATGSESEIMMDERNRTFSLNYNKPNQPQVSLQHSTRDAEQVGSASLGNSTSTDSLIVNWVKNGLSAGMNLNRTKTDSRRLSSSQDPYVPLPENPDPTNPIFTYKGITDTASVYMNYQPSDKMNIGVNWATNKITADTGTGKEKSGGSNMQANAMYKLTDTVTLNAALQSSKTDATQSASGSQSPALTSKNISMGAEWRAAKNLTLDMKYAKDRYEGGEFSNSTSSTLSANAMWQVNEKASLNGYWFTQDLQYLDSSSNSRSNMVGASAEIGPIGKATVKVDAQHLWGETATGVSNLYYSQAQAKRAVQMAPDTVGAANVQGNKLTTLAARVTYPIADKQDIFVAGETTRSSGFPSESSKNTIGLGWNYHLNDNMTFTLNAQRLSYTDQGNSDLNYNANQLNAQMSVNF